MEKKEIKISLGTFICLIIIAILVVAVIMMGLYITGDKKEVNNNELGLNENVTGQTQNNNGNNNTNKVNAIELDISSNEVQNLLEKKMVETPVKASMYRIGSFTRETIPNDLILKMAFTNLGMEGMETEEFYAEPFSSFGARLSGEQMKKAVQNILGRNMKYVDEEFIVVDEPIFYDYTAWQGTVTYDKENKEYFSWITEGGGFAQPWIDEWVQKAIKYDNKIEIYVNTAFINVTGDSMDDEIVNIYKGYDFTRKEFVNKIDEMPIGIYTGVAFGDPSEVDVNVRNRVNNDIQQLNTYVYTFEQDNTDGQYYLSAFNKAN